MHRSREKFLEAKRLIGSGVPIRAVARRLAVPYSTVQRWSTLDHPPRGRRRTPPTRWEPPYPAAYAYLLGIYLGDGCIGRTSPSAAQLSIAMDSRYPGIIAAVCEAIRDCVPGVHVGSRERNGGTHLYASNPIWLAAFPQHGPGRKHERRIELEEWQRSITHEHPEQFLRGLIHSDGSRVTNRFRTRLPSGRFGEYSYIRYFFTNYSADIRRIFCEHCELLGIRWTQSSFKNISISHRQATAKLDRFVGPKR